MNTETISESTVRTALKGTERVLLGVVGSVLLMASMLVGLAPSASAINTTPCGSRQDFASARHSGGYTCWANAGAVNVTRTGVTQLCSGNNVVTWTYRWSMGTSTLRQNRYSCTTFSNVTLTRISIA